MKMGHGFASVRPVVHHDAETVREPFGSGRLASHKKEMAKQGGILLACFSNPWDRFSRYHQKVDGGLRIYVSKHYAVIVLMDEVTGYFAVDDLTEEGFFGHCVL